MTCIVGYSENNDVWIGGDSAGVAGYSLTVRADEKVFVKENFIFGFTSSFRMGQLIRYKLDIPIPKENEKLDNYLHTSFLDSVISCFKNNQFANINNNKISGGSFLFGYKGLLYCIQSDFQIEKCYNNFNAVGCGGQIALGCLHGLKNSKLKPKEKVLKALEAAQEFSAGVRAPFHILCLKGK